MPFVAIVNIPGYLPESEPVTFDTARGAWEYLLEELERGELRWQADDLSDPDGPASSTETALAIERLAADDKEGLVYGPSYLPTEPDEDTSTDLGLAYSVEWVKREPCAWFVGCENEATGTVTHPILGEVAACDRCRELASPTTPANYLD